MVSRRPSLAPGWDAGRQDWRGPLFLGGVAVLLAILGVYAAFRLAQSPAVVPWSRLDTDDVHSLVFAGQRGDRLLFGHHGGLLESRDGGRSWTSLQMKDDAMSTATANDDSIIVAGHDVFAVSKDAGRSWIDIEADIPSRDIHGFTRDPLDPARMWAYLATGGLWESTDYGASFTRVREDNVAYPLAVGSTSGTRLFGVDATGLVASVDGGRSWEPAATPPTYPMTSLAGSADGTTLFAGASDGLFRSVDGGVSWSRTGYAGSVMALAVSPDGGLVALVNNATEFFRSNDGGSSWPGPVE